jgi:transposase-like protein
VDVEGNKHVLAIREGATENAMVTKELLEDLVARGVSPEQKRLFIIDGSKALRTAINAVSRCSAVGPTNSATCSITSQKIRRTR